ncbi:MAG: hypothetical protein J6J23_01870 [Clostridia bacterium]|nr:hypothetical protein [Clostridia bacterium]
MKMNPKMYGQQYDPEVLRDLNKINEKMEKTEDQEEILQLRMQRLYRGMELNSTPITRNYRGYYPY